MSALTIEHIETFIFIKIVDQHHQFYKPSNPMQHCPAGNQQNPISIDNDEEHQANIQKMLQAARNKDLIQQAQLTNQPIELCFAVAKTTVKGSFQTKNRQLNKAILNYFSQKINIKISHEFFYPKPQPDYSDLEAIINPLELIVYGVDFLTTNAIKARLQTLDTQIQQINWINGSTCKVICKSQLEADRIIKNQLKSIKIQQDSQSFKDWHSIKPYYIFAFQRPLFIRYSVINENFDVDKTNEKYDQFMQAKNELPLYILTKFNAVQKYKEVIRDIHLKNIRQRKNHRSNHRDQQYSRSRSRQREKNRPSFKKQKQQIRHQKRENKRNLFTDYSFQYDKKITYPHQPVNNHQDSYSIQQKPNQQNKQILSIDYNINKYSKKSNNKLNTSFQVNNKEKKVQLLNLYDHLSEVDSNLSFNYNNLAVGANTQEENRLDYHLSPQQQSNSNNDDLEYQLAQPPKKNTINNSFIVNEKKNKNLFDANQSFIVKSKANQQHQSSDFFDFDENLHPNKLKNKQTFDSSFRIEPKDIKSKKPYSNFNDDYSY